LNSLYFRVFFSKLAVFGLFLIIEMLYFWIQRCMITCMGVVGGMVLNVASTQCRSFCDVKTEGRTIEKELQGIKHKKEGTVRTEKDDISQLGFRMRGHHEDMCISAYTDQVKQQCDTHLFLPTFRGDSILQSRKSQSNPSKQECLEGCHRSNTAIRLDIDNSSDYSLGNNTIVPFILCRVNMLATT
jgi:hypothetical protein